MAFLECLRCEKVRQAFTTGDAAFVISTDCQTILWANGAGALCFDFAKVMEAISSPTFFDAKTRRDIAFHATNGESFKIALLRADFRFCASVIDLDDKSCAILLQALSQDVDGLPISLIDGLSDNGFCAAIVDGSGHILEASKNFTSIGKATAILLKSIDDDAPVKTRFIEDGYEKNIGVIRLSETPESFLLLSTVQPQDFPIESKSAFQFDIAHLPQRFTWKMDKNGLFTDVSQNFAAMVGARSGDVIGKSFSDLAEVLQNADLKQLDETIKTAKPWADRIIFLDLVDPRGKATIVFSGLPVLDYAGQCQGFRGSGMVTHFKSAVDELALNATPIDEKSSKLSDTERSAFREIAERLRMDLALPMRADENQAIEPDEHILNILDKNPVPDVNKSVKAATLLSLLDTATDGVIWLNLFGTIEQVSAAACALTGYDSIDLHHKKLSDIFSEKTRALIQNYFQSMQGQGKGQIFNTGETACIVTKSGGESTVFLTLVPLAEGQGYAALLRDTVMDQANGRVEDIQQSAAIAHEIRTPLNAMIGFAEIMQEERFGKIGNNRYLGYVRDIASSGKHILSLVNQLLEQGKQEQAGNHHFAVQKTKIKKLDLKTAIRNCVSLLENQANHEGVIVRVVLPQTLPPIAISEKELRQILWNLLSNAIRFTKAGGQVVINASTQGKDAVKITVSDNGIGMDPQEILRAMEPYGQIERIDGRTGDKVFAGTGLGLPMTKAMVESHDGSFRLLSKPGHGTTVEMTFPLFRD